MILAIWETWQASEDFWQQTGVFLSLTLRGLGVALLIGLPAGIALTRLPRIAPPVIAVLALLQTMPSLALLGLMIPLLGIGAKAAIFAAVVYSLFPIVMNTHIGITQVEPAIRDAARGMGMSGRQILWKVELPLALPVVLAGVRTGAVYAIGIITVCALVGAGGLGDYIVTGMDNGDNDLVLLGALPILALTLLLFWGLGAVARLAKKNSNLGLLVGGGLIILLAGYALAEPWLRSRRAELRLGSKNFTEGRILTEILRLLLETHTDLRVDVTNLGNKLVYKSLKSGEIDLYVEYTGNLLTHKDALGLPVPADKATILPLVQQEMLRRHHLAVLEPFGLNNTYVVCLPREVAEKHGIKTISDLRSYPQMKVIVDLSFLKRPDGWEGLIKTYNLQFRHRPTQVSPNFLYKSLETKEVDIVIGNATDWQIGAYDLKVLADDRGFFPHYHAVPVIRESVLKRYPQIAEILNRLKGRIDDQTMRRLNEQVAREERPVSEVAREFLEKQGLLEKKQ